MTSSPHSVPAEPCVDCTHDYCRCKERASNQHSEHDNKGFSEEKCLRCGWVMGSPALNCQNDDTPHRFPSQDGLFEQLETLREAAQGIVECEDYWDWVTHYAPRLKEALSPASTHKDDDVASLEDGQRAEESAAP